MRIIQVRARTRFLVVGCESGVYVAPVEQDGASNSFSSLFNLLMDYSDGISTGIEFHEPYLTSGTDRAWAQNV